jgi:hypothetical protein
MDDLNKIRKKIREEIDRNLEADDSDIPVHERFVSEQEIKDIRKNKRN